MKTLLRNLILSPSASTPSHQKVPAPDAQRAAASMAIDAWSEVMGRDAAELWVAANSSQQALQDRPIH